MIKKLTKHGNSSALILDRALLEVLNISADTELKISISGRSLVITPVEENVSFKVSDDPEMQKAFEEVMKKYAPAFKKLSKN